MNPSRPVRQTIRLLAVIALGCMTALGAGLARAQYPSKPVRLIVPFAPGGYTDIVARILTPKLREELGQPVIVENRSGSGGNLGAEAVAKALPDGYFLMMAAPPVAINPVLYKSLPYDPGALAPVAMIADFPNVLVVGANSSDRTLKDLIERARRNPGKLNYASNGAGTSTHLTSELLKMHTRTFIVHIPYRGAPAAQMALMMGDADFYFNNLAPALPQIRAGRLRALAVTTAKRAPLLPDVPTMAEAGLPEVEVSAFLGIMTTSGTPPEIISRLETVLQKVLSHPEIVAGIERQGGVVQFMGSRQFRASLAAESRKWAEAVKHSGATAD